MKQFLDCTVNTSNAEVRKINDFFQLENSIEVLEIDESIDDLGLEDLYEDSELDEMFEDYNRSLAVYDGSYDNCLNGQHCYDAEEDDYNDDVEEYYGQECLEWTEEDAWDALTDGMYGDMPSNPLAYDAMMDVMGF